MRRYLGNTLHFVYIPNHFYVISSCDPMQAVHMECGPHLRARWEGGFWNPRPTNPIYLHWCKLRRACNSLGQVVVLCGSLDGPSGGPHCRHAQFFFFHVIGMYEHDPFLETWGWPLKRANIWNSVRLTSSITDSWDTLLAMSCPESRFFMPWMVV